MGFLSCGSKNQVPYLNEIKKMDFKIFLLDKNKDAPGINLSDKYEYIGYDQIEKLKSLIRNEFFCDNKIKHVFCISILPNWCIRCFRNWD